MPYSKCIIRATLQITISGAVYLYVGVSLAETPRAPLERQRVYQNDRQHCLAGQTGQSQVSCLQEAGAVLHQPFSVRGQVSIFQLRENALQRCEYLRDGQRQSCIARMDGQGRVQGSVASGGILRELTEPGQ